MAGVAVRLSDVMGQFAGRLGAGDGTGRWYKRLCALSATLWRGDGSDGGLPRS